MNYNYNKKSIWKWILLYVLIAAVAYGLVYYFFFYNKGGYAGNYQAPMTNSQTAGWKVYKSDKFGFEFKFPKDWQVWEANSSSGLVVIFPESKSEQVMNKTISTTDEITFSIVDGLPDLTKTEEIVVNNQSWFVKNHNGPFDGGTENGIEYFKFIGLKRYLNIATGVSNRELLLKIFSTFKFTE